MSVHPKTELKHNNPVYNRNSNRNNTVAKLEFLCPTFEKENKKKYYQIMD